MGLYSGDETIFLLKLLHTGTEVKESKIAGTTILCYCYRIHACSNLILYLKNKLECF